MFSIPKTYAPIKGKWSVKYCRDTLLSGYLSKENLFSIFYGEPEYDLHSDLIDDQRLGIGRPQKHVSGLFDIRGQRGGSAWGVFYWMVEGSNKQYFYDVRVEFIDKDLAKIELVPARESERYYRKLIIDTNQKIKRGMKDHIVGLIKVNNERTQMWGATTSIDLEGSKDRFVSLPYFIANLIEEKTKSASIRRQMMNRWDNLSEQRRSLVGTIITSIGAILAIIGIIVGILAIPW